MRGYERCPPHLVVVEGVNHSDESPCLWSHADGDLGNVLDKEGVEVAAELQIISCTQRLQETVNIRSHDTRLAVLKPSYCLLYLTAEVLKCE